MVSRPTYDDANLILRLYEMRREERMREARAWFTAHFRPKKWEELATLVPPGSAENASYRMVISYWDMVASFVVTGVLNKELFFQSGRELLLLKLEKNLISLLIFGKGREEFLARKEMNDHDDKLNEENDDAIDGEEGQSHAQEREKKSVENS